MAGEQTTTYFEPSKPLTAMVLPSGQVIISHADPETGAPVYSTNADRGPLTDLLEGQIFGVDKKLIALGVLAWLLLKGK